MQRVADGAKGNELEDGKGDIKGISRSIPNSTGKSLNRDSGEGIALTDKLSQSMVATHEMDANLPQANAPLGESFLIDKRPEGGLFYLCGQVYNQRELVRIKGNSATWVGQGRTGQPEELRLSLRAITIRCARTSISATERRVAHSAGDEAGNWATISIIRGGSVRTIASCVGIGLTAVI